MALLKLVAEDFVDGAALEKPPSFEGRWLSMILAPLVQTPGSPDAVEEVEKAAKA